MEIFYIISSTILSSASCLAASLFLIVGWWTGKGAEPQLISGQSQVQIVIYSVILAVSTLKLSMTTAFNQVNRNCPIDYWRIFKVPTNPALAESQNRNDIELQVYQHLILQVSS